MSSFWVQVETTELGPAFISMSKNSWRSVGNSKSRCYIAWDANDSQ